MQKLTNVAFLLFLGIVAWYIAKHHDEVFGSGEEPFCQQIIDSITASVHTSNSTLKTQNSKPKTQSLDEGIEETVYETFRFDPNTADTTALLRLGFPRWMVRSMMKYRAKGGRYQVIEDVKAIYGMTPELYERIAGYINIDPRFKPYDRDKVEAERREAREQLSDKKTEEHTAEMGDVHIDLNTADSAELCRVRGIGRYRAKQILDLRRKLGAFVSIDQLAMIEGIPDSCLQWFGITPGLTIQINLNTASLSEMRKHPCIGPRKAADIERLRRQNGRIEALEQLKMLQSFNTDDIDKLRPYAEL